MSEFRNIKIFGGIGALLSLLGFVPYVGPLLSIVGLILVFVAVKTISNITKDDEIFKNYLYHFIMSIIAIVAIITIMIIGFGAAGGFNWISSLQNANITDFNSFWQYFGSIVSACIISLVIAWILSIIGAIFLKRSYKAIAKHTDVHLFETTGTVYFIGAITSIIVIGLLILFVAKILEIIAYFSLPDEPPRGDKIEKSQRRCPNCGRIIPEDALSCPYCAKKF